MFLNYLKRNICAFKTENNIEPVILRHSKSSSTAETYRVMEYATVRIGYHSYTCRLVVSEVIQATILGMNWHMHLDVKVDYDDKTSKLM